MPTEVHPNPLHIIKSRKQLFSTQLGKTTTIEHVIDTGEATPIVVPLRPIPFHFAEKVHNQLQEMAQDGIIQPSNSPWCVPAIYVLKDNREIRIRVDFVQLIRAIQYPRLKTHSKNWLVNMLSPR